MLKITNLHSGYEDLNVLRGIDIEIGDKEIAEWEKNKEKGENSKS